MRLTTKGRYAVRAVLDLTNSSNGRPVPVREISIRQNISVAYLEQLFCKLRRGKLVRAVRGPGGGYVLARPMDEISIKEILVSVGENIDPGFDLLGDADLTAQTIEFVLTKSHFENLGILMEEYLATTSVGDLIRKARGELRPGLAPNADLENIVLPESVVSGADQVVPLKPVWN